MTAENAKQRHRWIHHLLLSTSPQRRTQHRPTICYTTLHSGAAKVPHGKLLLTCITLKPSKNGHTLPRGITKYGLKSKPLKEASTQPSQRDNQALTQKGNFIGDKETKKENRDKGKPTAVEAKANGVEATQDSMDPLIQMPWIQVPLHEKSTLRKRNSAIGRKDNVSNAQKSNILHNSALTENPVPSL